MNFLVETRPVTGVLAGRQAPELLRDERVHEIVARAAARTPHAVAVRFGEMFMTYDELDRLAGEWALGLRALGARPGVVVGVWCARGPAALVMVLAVLKSGAAFLPFDELALPARVAGCLVESGARLLVTDAAHQGILAVPGCAVVGVDAICLAAFGAQVPVARPAAEDAAYVAYVDGPAGELVGVAISHRSLCHLVRAQNEVLRLNGEDVVFDGASLASDRAILGIFGAWLVGGCLDVGPAAEDFAARRVSVVHGREAMLGDLKGDLAGVRLVTVSGLCPEALLRQLWRPERRVVGIFGPAETSGAAACAELHPKMKVSLGFLLPNYTAVICEGQGRRVPEGELGELYIGGPGVGMGYVGRPELTAARFLPAGEVLPDARMAGYFFRTGEMARVNGRGELER